MAHCLILLAAGAAHASDPSPALLPSSTAPHQSQAPPPRAERYTSRKYTEAAATPDGVRAGFYVYECKTCNKCFPTFQALGGHRASHKRPRVLQHQQQPVVADHAGLCLGRQQPPQPPPTPKPRVHACPVCGLEFAIGQALGGHMRRHRADAEVRPPPPDKARDVAGGICLDLNLTPSENCAKCRSVVVLGAAGQGVHKALAMLDCSL